MYRLADEISLRAENSETPKKLVRGSLNFGRKKYRRGVEANLVCRQDDTNGNKRRGYRRSRIAKNDVF